MKPESIEEKKAKRKREAVRGVAVFVVIQLFSAALIGWVCFLPNVPRWCAVVCAVIAVLCVALILPALMVLKTRFREIEGGELDEAGKY